MGHAINRKNDKIVVSVFKCGNGSFEAFEDMKRKYLKTRTKTLDSHIDKKF